MFSLHFRLEPNRTLATKRLAGKKMQKERLTIALTCNVDGSVKLPPFVIYKYQRPRAFTKRNIANPNNLGILWFHNKKAWMTTALFEKFLLDFERRMSLAGKRRVLLLVDNLEVTSTITSGQSCILQPLSFCLQIQQVISSLWMQV